MLTGTRPTCSRGWRAVVEQIGAGQERGRVQPRDARRADEPAAPFRLVDDFADVERVVSLQFLQKGNGQLYIFKN